MNFEFKVPRDALSQDPHQRRANLDRYFPSGMIPLESHEGNGWNVFCFIPADEEYYVDTQLGKVLKSWLGISIADMGEYYHFQKNAMFSLYDSWSIYYWSLLNKWLIDSGNSLRNCALVHIDDHLDFASPHLIEEDENYQSLFSRRPVSFSDPLSISRAITDKSIGIGSFISPLIHFIPDCDVFHWKCSYRGAHTRSYLQKSFECDTLLSPQSHRPSLLLDKTSKGSTYFISNHFDDFTSHLRKYEHILLHIDCDAFANRYNLDSDWHKYTPTIDLPIQEIKDKISHLFGNMKNLSASIYLNVAFSPGFFPSEHWEEIYSWIFEHAEKAGILENNQFSEFLSDAASRQDLNASDMRLPIFQKV